MHRRILGFDVTNEDGASGEELLLALFPEDTTPDERSPLNGNKLLCADGSRLTSLQARFALHSRWISSKPAKLLSYLKTLRGDDQVEHSLEPWAAAYDELSKQASAEANRIIKRIHEDLDQDRNRPPRVPDIAELRLSELAAASQLTVLQASVDNSSHNATAEQSSSFQPTQAALDIFQRMWQDRDTAAEVFVIIEKGACADGVIQQMNVCDKAAVQRELQAHPAVWKGDGRVAYIGVILRSDAHIKAIQKMLEPVIEPTLSLMLTLDCGDTAMDMTVQMFMRKHRNKACPEVALTSSNSERNKVRDLVDDVKAKFRASFKLDRDFDCRPELGRLCLQRDESTDAICGMEGLDLDASLGSLLFDRQPNAVAEAFQENNIEARLWVATMTLGVEPSQLQLLKPAPSAVIDVEPEMPSQPSSSSKSGVNSNQTAVANEIIQRIMITRDLIRNEPDSYKRGLERLREAYSEGIDFVVLTPVYLTLRQQTLQRLLDAGLKNSDGSDPVVLPYAFSAQTVALFTEFRAKVTSTPNRLFVMVVDEAHHAAVRRGAHDAFANDFRCQTPDGLKHCAHKTGYEDQLGEWHQYSNLVSLLVSATPACALTANSRVPRQYYVPDQLTREQRQLPGCESLVKFSIIKPHRDQPHGTILSATSWVFGNTQIQATDLEQLISQKAVRELHVIDWSDAEVEHVPYRSITDYVEGSTKPRFVHHGIFCDDVFHSRMVASRTLVKGVDIDVLLALDYITSMQYFRVFRWDPSAPFANGIMQLLDIDESKSLLWNSNEAIEEFLRGLQQTANRVQPEQLYKAVCTMLKSPIKAAVENSSQAAADSDASQHWLRTKYEQLSAEHNLPGWPDSYKQGDTNWYQFDKSALRVLLHCKMDAELSSHAAGLHSDVCQRQFTETDRIVKSLLVTERFSDSLSSGGQATMSDTDAGPETSAQAPSLNGAVKGPMIVIRARPDGMGEKIVNILKEFLRYTSTRSNPWQHEANATLPSWQLFEVIGDLGESDQIELLAKLSPWARLRPMSPDHPERSEQGFWDYWHKAGCPPSLQCYTDYVQAKEKAAHAQAVEAGRKPPRKSAGLQYSDLYGVPTILVLCEKGRMGDTFPHTFTCQDQRLRSGNKYSTLVQELGRLCRYPAVEKAVPLATTPAMVSQQGRHAGLLLLEQALHQAYGRQNWRGGQDSAWMNTVNTIAAASSSQIADLIKRMHQVAAQSKQSGAMDNATAHDRLCSAMQAVVSMPGADVNELQSGASLRSMVDSISSALQSPAAVPHTVLRTHVEQLVAWRQQVLMTLDGSGCKFSCNEVPEFQQGLPVRILVNGRFVADCLDSNDLVKVFCCCPATSPLLQPDNIVSIARYKHRLPYALVNAEFANHLEKVQRATALKQQGATGQSLRQSIDKLSEDVMENWPTGGRVDKFMAYTRPGLRGSPVHNYRDAATACNKHYDTQNTSVHESRFLLKAQPQQGKTGAYIGLLQQLKTVLEPDDKWQPTPAAPLPQPPNLKAKDKWVHPKTAALRWQHSCFPELTAKWRLYDKLLPGKYADRVAMQRLVLLASVCYAQSQHKGMHHEPWPKQYKDLVLSVHGENICTEAGRKLAGTMEQELHQTRLPIKVETKADSGNTAPRAVVISIVNAEAVKQAVNWDKRIEEAASQFALGRSLPSLAESGISWNSSPGTLQGSVIAVQNVSCVSAICSLGVPDSQGAAHYNLVQDTLWPQVEATEEAPDAHDLPGSWTAAATYRTSAQLPQNGHMAHTMRIGRVLRPIPVPTAGLMKLEAKVPQLSLTHEERETLFPVQQKGNLPATNGPVLLATAAVWQKLSRCSQHGVVVENATVAVQNKATDRVNEAAVSNWIFVPSFGRHKSDDPKQMRIDWADAVSHATPYVRVVVVRSDEKEVEGYSRLIHDHQLQMEKHLPDEPHATLLMIMPAVVDLKGLPARHARLQPYQRQRVTESMGIGYARLCIQLVSRLMGMTSIWMLDDNLSDCWRLPFEQFISSGGQHGQLQPVSFDTVFRTIEHQTVRSVAKARHFGSSNVASQLQDKAVMNVTEGTELQSRNSPAHVSPRFSAGKTQEAATDIQVLNMTDLTGDYSTYAVISADLNIKDAHKVGLEGCPGPWTITPSVYSMLLINVESTVKSGALYPAKPYHEDVDFAHLCEEKQLVVIKCNWLFFHKARLTKDFIWNQSPVSKTAKLVLSHPTNGHLFTGQMIRFCAPSAFGRPTAIALGTLPSAHLENIVRDANADGGDLSYYVVCMVLVPEVRQCSGQLAVTFGESGGNDLKTSTDVTLTRLYPWPQARDCFAPFQLSRGAPLTQLGLHSQQLQLECIIREVEQYQSSPLLRLCLSMNSITAALGFQHYESVLKSGNQPILWLSNQLVLAQHTFELSTSLQTLVGLFGMKPSLQLHGPHYFVMQYSSAHNIISFQQVSDAFVAASSSGPVKFVVKTVMTTVQPEASVPSEGLPLGAIAEHSALPHMLVVFTVGEPPAEDILMHSVSSSSSEAIDLTDDSQPVAEPSQPTPPAQLLRKRQLSSHKKPREDEQSRERSLQPVQAAVTSAGLGEQGSTAGPLSSQQPLSPETSSQLPGGASASGLVQQQSDMLKSSPAEARNFSMASPSEQLGSGLAAAGSSAGPSLDSPPSSPQVPVKRHKASPGGKQEARVRAVVMVLQGVASEASPLQKKNIISLLKNSSEDSVRRTVQDMDPEGWASKALQQASGDHKIRRSKNKYWVDLEGDTVR